MNIDIISWVKRMTAQGKLTDVNRKLETRNRELEELEKMKTENQKVAANLDGASDKLKEVMKKLHAIQLKPYRSLNQAKPEPEPEPGEAGVPIRGTAEQVLKTIRTRK